MTTARFEHSVEDAEQVRRGVTAIYWVIAAVIAVAGVLRRELLVVAAVFAVVLVVWQRSIRRAMPTRPWVLEIGPDRITLDRNGTVESVTKGDPAVADFVRGLRVRADHEGGVAAALAEHGWPTLDRS